MCPMSHPGSTLDHTPPSMAVQRGLKGLSNGLQRSIYPLVDHSSRSRYVLISVQEYGTIKIGIIRCHLIFEEITAVL